MAEVDDPLPVSAARVKALEEKLAALHAEHEALKRRVDEREARASREEDW